MNWYKFSQHLSIQEELGISAPKKYYLFSKEKREVIPEDDAISGVSHQFLTEEEADHLNATYAIGQWMTAEEIKEWLLENKGR